LSNPWLPTKRGTCAGFRHRFQSTKARGPVLKRRKFKRGRARIKAFHVPECHISSSGISRIPTEKRCQNNRYDKPQDYSMDHRSEVQKTKLTGFQNDAADLSRQVFLSGPAWPAASMLEEGLSVFS